MHAMNELPKQKPLKIDVRGEMWLCLFSKTAVKLAQDAAPFIKKTKKKKKYPDSFYLSRSKQLNSKFPLPSVNMFAALNPKGM